MAKLTITVDLPFFTTGLELGDVIDSVQKALEPVKQEAWAHDNFDSIEKYGTILNPHSNDELIGDFVIDNK